MADNPLFAEHTPATPQTPEQGVSEQGQIFPEQRINPFESITQPTGTVAQDATAGALLDQLRQGPLAAAVVPTSPMESTELDQIKQLLFPGVDLEKATPQELVTYLLINHELHPDQAHKWVEFLAQTHEPHM
ncbi:MAG: hypothetical protein JNK33_03985 [Candidatus Doudnabacteria bacterium]|nr:hypothetical protein [Candidatus Doudnabacteria bacterium]